APSFGSTGKMSLFDLYKASPLAVIGNCLTGMAHGTLFGLGAIYASAIFTDLKSISWFMASFLLGSLITQWPIGYLSDHIGRRAVMASLSIVAIVCCIFAIHIDKTGWLIFLVMLMLGSAAMPMYSVCVAYANDRLEPHQIVAASGSLVMVSGIGLMTGPILVAFLMEYFVMDAYFWGIASFFALILLFTLVRMNSRAGVAIKDQTHLVAGPIGTPIAEYNAPDSVEYAEAVSNNDFDYLDQYNDEVEREE
ncbi:MAG: MFS family permease, partial [Gammaproteobacteria bacterium]